MTAQLVLFGGHVGAAEFSHDGRFRYTLYRSWGPGSEACFVMLNPSTADATDDDPTIRRCTRYASCWGFGRLVVVNLFALRSTDPKALYRAAVASDCHGLGYEMERHIDAGLGSDMLNDSAIVQSAQNADQVVCAWGGHGKLRGRGKAVAAMLADYDVELWCFGMTAAQQPRHPLYLRRDACLVPMPVGMVEGVI